MHIYLVSIFPEIFTSFLQTSLIKKAQEKSLLSFYVTNPREYCNDKHKQIDDVIYWWWAGMLMKAEPLINSVEEIIKKNKLTKKKFMILFMTPSKELFTQKAAHTLAKNTDIIFVCWRYEWIDYRFQQYMKKKYPKNFKKISLWTFVTMWWELPAMTMIEGIVRLLPWVIKESDSWKDESYTLQQDMKNIEYPQYTRPEEIYGMKVPKELRSGNHKKIQERRNKKTTHL